MKALITGGSRGIGKAICDHFTYNGIEVINPSSKELNLSDFNQVKSYLSSLTDLHIIVNNAAINDLKQINQCNVKDIKTMFDINFFSPCIIVSHFLDKFKKQNYGRIINIGSILSYRSKSSRFIYSSSKAALHSFTKSIVSETFGYNILSNTISPGYVQTDLTYKNNCSDSLLKIKEKIPVKKLCQPAEIAKWVYNLSVDNKYINGQEIIIDGGLTCTI